MELCPVHSRCCSKGTERIRSHRCSQVLQCGCVSEARVQASVSVSVHAYVNQGIVNTEQHSSGEMRNKRLREPVRGRK